MFKRTQLKMMVKARILDARAYKRLAIQAGRHGLAEYWLGKEVAYTEIMEML